MEIRNLVSDEDAVSPVIGVILMVAITVILAAVIGTFVLGLGGNVNSTPQAQFTFSFDSTTDASITHDGGDTIDGDNLQVVIGGTLAYDGTGLDTSPSGVTDADGDNLRASFDPNDASGNPNDWTGSDIVAGTTLDISAGSSQAGNSVRVVYVSPSSDNTATLISTEWEA